MFDNLFASRSVQHSDNNITENYVSVSVKPRQVQAVLFAYMKNKTTEELTWDSVSVLKEKGQCWGARERGSRGCKMKTTCRGQLSLTIPSLYN